MPIPETTAIAKMATVVANLLDREITTQADSELLQRIAERFRQHWKSEFDALAADPASPTNAELAGFFLLKMKDFGKDILRAQGQQTVHPDASTVAAAGEAAAADLE
jgi:hypothetical protein